MNDAAASYFHAIRMCRLKGLLTGEFWPHEEDTFDLVMAAAMARKTAQLTGEYGMRIGDPGRRFQRLSPSLIKSPLLRSKAND